VELTIVEPSDESVDYARILSVPKVKKDFGNGTFTFRWDGKLYPGGDEQSGYWKYAERSDLFMTAKVDVKIRQRDPYDDVEVINRDLYFNNIAFSFPGPSMPFWQSDHGLEYTAYLWNNRDYIHGGERIPDADNSADHFRVGYWIKSGGDKVRAYIKYRYDLNFAFESEKKG